MRQQKALSIFIYILMLMFSMHVKAKIEPTLLEGQQNRTSGLERALLNGTVEVIQQTPLIMADGLALDQDDETPGGPDALLEIAPANDALTNVANGNAVLPTITTPANNATADSLFPLRAAITPQMGTADTHGSSFLSTAQISSVHTTGNTLPSASQTSTSINAGAEKGYPHIPLSTLNNACLTMSAVAQRRHMTRTAKLKMCAALSGVQLGATVLMYKKNANFRRFIDSNSEDAKTFLMRKVALPVAIKAEQIKEQGLSKKDIAYILLFLGGCYALKKVAGYLELVHLIKTGDTSKTKKALNNAWSYVKEHKKAFIGLGMFAGFGTFLYRQISAVAEKATHISLLDKLFYSFSTEQRIAVIESEEIGLLVSEAHSDPQQLKDSQSFQSLLTDNQKEVLDQAVIEFDKQKPMQEVDSYKHQGLTNIVS